MVANTARTMTRATWLTLACLSASLAVVSAQTAELVIGNCRVSQDAEEQVLASTCDLRLPGGATARLQALEEEVAALKLLMSPSPPPFPPYAPPGAQGRVSPSFTEGVGGATSGLGAIAWTQEGVRRGSCGWVMGSITCASGAGLRERGCAGCKSLDVPPRSLTGEQRWVHRGVAPPET